MPFGREKRRDEEVGLLLHVLLFCDARWLRENVGSLFRRRDMFEFNETSCMNSANRVKSSIDMVGTDIIDIALCVIEGCFGVCEELCREIDGFVGY